MSNYLVPLYIDLQGNARKRRTFPDLYSTTSMMFLKRGDTYTFAVQFIDDNLNPYLLLPGSTVKLAAKASNQFDATTSIVAGSTSSTPGSVDTPYYVELSLSTVALDALLLNDGNVNNDVPYVDLMFEVTWSEAALKWNSTIAPITVRIYNDVIRGDEGAPSANPQLWGEALALTAPPVDGVAGVAASGLITFTGVPTASQTITLNGRVYTFQPIGPLASSEILIGANAEATATNIAIAINAPSIGSANANVNASVLFSGYEVRLTAKVSGVAGNAITLNATASNTGVSGATLTGGVNAITGTVATAIGQLAIITTTNASGTFRDVWTAAAMAPFTIWRPPGNIKKDRSNGLLYREFYSGGLPATELAYP